MNNKRPIIFLCEARQNSKLTTITYHLLGQVYEISWSVFEITKKSTSYSSDQSVNKNFLCLSINVKLTSDYYHQLNSITYLAQDIELKVNDETVENCKNCTM